MNCGVVPSSGGRTRVGSPKVADAGRSAPASCAVREVCERCSPAVRRQRLELSADLLGSPVARTWIDEALELPHAQLVASVQTALEHEPCPGDLLCSETAARLMEFVASAFVVAATLPCFSMLRALTRTPDVPELALSSAAHLVPTAHRGIAALVDSLDEGVLDDWGHVEGVRGFADSLRVLCSILNTALPVVASDSSHTDAVVGGGR